MNVEKFIKNEAKKSLKGNWYKAIAAVCLLLIMPLLVYIIISMAYAMLGDSESVTEALPQRKKLMFQIFFITMIQKRITLIRSSLLQI